jgi:Domain of unknown function
VPAVADARKASMGGADFVTTIAQPMLALEGDRLPVRTNGIHSILFDIQNRTLGPELAALNTPRRSNPAPHGAGEGSSGTAAHGRAHARTLALSRRFQGSDTLSQKGRCPRATRCSGFSQPSATNKARLQHCQRGLLGARLLLLLLQDRQTDRQTGEALSVCLPGPR